MSFSAPEWETNDLGDNTYSDLFPKKRYANKKGKVKLEAQTLKSQKTNNKKINKTLNSPTQKGKNLANDVISQISINNPDNGKQAAKNLKKKLKRLQNKRKQTVGYKDSKGKISTTNSNENFETSITTPPGNAKQITKKLKKTLKKSQKEQKLITNETNDKINANTTQDFKASNNTLVNDKQVARKQKKKLKKSQNKQNNNTNTHNADIINRTNTNDNIKESINNAPDNDKQLPKKLKKKLKRLQNKQIKNTEASKDDETNHANDNKNSSDQKLKKKKLRKVNKNMEEHTQDTTNNNELLNIGSSSLKSSKKKNNDLNILALKNQLFNSNNSTQNSKHKSLRERMQGKLKAARFRFLNEQLYTTEGKDAQKLFKSDPEAFDAYHDGFRQQVARWPLNPLDTIIKAIKKLPRNLVVADFGCGEAKLSRSVPQRVHSFDLVARASGVTACDMAHVPLPPHSVDVAVFCLALMGTNLRDFLAEANRVLRLGGTLKIAEVESRFDQVETFIEGLKRYGFNIVWQDMSHNLFYFLDFKKERDIVHVNKLPTISMHPCLYKKR